MQRVPGKDEIAFITSCLNYLTLLDGVKFAGLHDNSVQWHRQNGVAADLCISFKVSRNLVEILEISLNSNAR